MRPRTMRAPTRRRTFCPGVRRAPACRRRRRIRALPQAEPLARCGLRRGSPDAGSPRAGMGSCGTDVSARAVEALKADRFDAHLGEVDDLHLEDAGFDVVTLVKALEQVDDPGALVAGA